MRTLNFVVIKFVYHIHDIPYGYSMDVLIKNSEENIFRSFYF